MPRGKKKDEKIGVWREKVSYYEVRVSDNGDGTYTTVFHKDAPKIRTEDELKDFIRDLKRWGYEHSLS